MAIDAIYAAQWPFFPSICTHLREISRICVQNIIQSGESRPALNPPAKGCNLTDAPTANSGDLTALIESADSFDRSWSISAEGKAEERFLLFFDRVDGRSQKMAALAAQMGMSHTALAQWRLSLSGADAMGLALNAQKSTVRLYSQYWDQLASRVAGGNLAPYPVYRGIKSLPDGGMRDDSYLCQPMAPRSEFWPLIETALAELGLPKADVAMAFADLDDDNCIFTRTGAANRQSWLATVRRAQIDKAAWHRALTALPDTPWAAALRDHALKHDLLHLAAGRDNSKGEFVSLYFTADAEQLLAVLR